MGRSGLLAVLLAAAVGVAGCGGSSAKSGTTATQPTMAHVCASHPEDVGKIAAGLFAYKYAMDHETTTGLASITEEVKEGVSGLQSAAVGATSSNLPAMRKLLEWLGKLSERFAHPPQFPNPLAGEQQTTEVESSAREVGCKF